MAYYKAPVAFLLTLGLNSFLKAFFLRLCESFAALGKLPISQALFMCFLLSCVASLSSLTLSGKRSAWTYKLVAIVGGRENSPKVPFYPADQLPEAPLRRYSYLFLARTRADCRFGLPHPGWRIGHRILSDFTFSVFAVV